MTKKVSEDVVLENKEEISNPEVVENSIEINEEIVEVPVQEIAEDLKVEKTKKSKKETDVKQEEVIEKKENKKEKEEHVEEMHCTNHRFLVGEEVWVPEFTNTRGSGNFSQVVNSYQFIPKKGVVERIIITDVVQYKLKNKAGSLYDEDDVCYSEDEVIELCNKKNNL